MRRAALALLLLLALPAAAGAGWDAAFAPPPAGQGLDDRVDALCRWNGHLYAGGQFIQAGGTAAWAVARWDSSGWSDLAGGMNGRVSALVVHDGTLVAGGRFTTAGGVPVRYVARWDGAAWSPVGDPAAWTWNDVIALAVQDTLLWAAGTGFVVRWDGADWTPVTGSGFTADVFALALHGGELVAGGNFTAVVDTAGHAVTASRVAAWDGTAWHALGSGCDGTVYGLADWNGTLVAGGVFAAPAPLLAAWDGGGWYGLGGGLTGTAVVALAGWGARLAVGGDFTDAGGAAARRVAIWNGSGWTAPAGGVNGLVRAALGDGADLWLGGDFTLADTLASVHVARWTDPTVAAPAHVPAPIRLGAPFPNPFNPRVAVPVTATRPVAATLTVYDPAGRRVRTLWRGVLAEGHHVLAWDGRDEGGRPVAAGSYLLRLDAAAETSTRRLLLAR